MTDLARGDDLAAVDQHVAHGAVGSMVDGRAQRIARRHHLRHRQIEEREIGFFARRDAPEGSVTQRRSSAADRRRVKQFGRRHRFDVAGGDAGQIAALRISSTRLCGVVSVPSPIVTPARR